LPAESVGENWKQEFRRNFDMRVSRERIKERFAQFKRDGVKVLAVLEMSAGVKGPPFGSTALTSNPCKEVPEQIGAREHDMVGEK
jgi:hypothetical protein